MNRDMLRKAAKTAAVAYAALALSWLLPPLARRPLRLCPLGPDGLPQAQAIPAFARKYQTSCTTCHSAPPKLNSFGTAFRLNGYQFPVDDEAMVKDKPLDLGVDAHKEQFPHEVWPSQIPGMPPIAIRFFGDATYNRGSKAKTNFDFPSFWRLLAGGSFDDRISAFMTICNKSVDDEMREGQVNNRVIAFQAQLVFKDLLDGTLGRDRLNLRAGLIDVPNLAFQSFFQHLTVSNYLYGATKLPGSKNDFAFLTPGGAPGAELYGSLAQGRLYYAVGLNNGDNFGTQDDNSDKDNYVVARYKLGGIPYAGPGVTAAGLQGEGPGGGGFWNDNSVQVGTLWYRGSAEVDGGFQDRFNRGGVDLRLQHLQERGTPSGAWELTGGLLWGRNRNPWGNKSDKRADFSSWFAEGSYFVFPWLIPSLRYEGVDLDDTPAAVVGPGVPFSVNARRFVPSLTVRLRHNLKWTAEGNLYEKVNGSTGGQALDDAHSALMRLDVAF